MKEVYNLADSGKKNLKPAWSEVQGLAFKEDKGSLDELTKLVLEAERTSIRLPVLRTAVKSRDFKDKAGETWSVKKGDTIICDIVRPGSSLTRMTTDSCLAVPSKRQSRGNRQSNRQTPERDRLPEPQIQRHRAIRRLRSKAPRCD